jgi:hypothetical protein
MVAVRSTETSVDFYRNTRHHISRYNHHLYESAGNANAYEYEQISVGMFYMCRQCISGLKIGHNETSASEALGCVHAGNGSVLTLSLFRVEN